MDTQDGAQDGNLAPIVRAKETNQWIKYRPTYRDIQPTLARYADVDILSFLHVFRPSAYMHPSMSVDSPVISYALPIRQRTWDIALAFEAAYASIYLRAGDGLFLEQFYRSKITAMLLDQLYSPMLRHLRTKTIDAKSASPVLHVLTDRPQLLEDVRWKKSWAGF